MFSKLQGNVNLIETLKESGINLSLNLNDYLVELALMSDLRMDNTVIISEILVIKAATYKVSIYNKITDGNEESRQFIVEVKTEVLTKDNIVTATFYESKNNEDTVITELEYESLPEIETLNSDEEFLEEFPYDDNYYPGILLENTTNEEVTTSVPDWLLGCLPGGYIYCGGKCGKCSSSAKGVNTLDEYCHKHDCCYANRGVDSYPNCYCDPILCTDAKKTNYIGSKVVQVAMCYHC